MPAICSFIHRLLLLLLVAAFLAFAGVFSIAVVIIPLHLCVVATNPTSEAFSYSGLVYDIRRSCILSRNGVSVYIADFAAVWKFADVAGVLIVAGVVACSVFIYYFAVTQSARTQSNEEAHSSLVALLPSHQASLRWLACSITPFSLYALLVHLSLYCFALLQGLLLPLLPQPWLHRAIVGFQIAGQQIKVNHVALILIGTAFIVPVIFLGNCVGLRHARARGRTCSACGYPKSSKRCPECGTVQRFQPSHSARTRAVLRKLVPSKRVAVAALILVTGLMGSRAFLYNMLIQSPRYRTTNYRQSDWEARDLLLQSTPFRVVYVDERSDYKISINGIQYRLMFVAPKNIATHVVPSDQTTSNECVRLICIENDLSIDSYVVREDSIAFEREGAVLHVVRAAQMSIDALPTRSSLRVYAKQFAIEPLSR
jgi:hypothetical protein